MIAFKLLLVFILLFGFSYGNTKKLSCGRKIFPRSLIRDGIETSVDEWPWAASLIYKVDGQFFCAGSLIKLRTVLTAAHCVQDKSSIKVLRPEEVIIQFGIANLCASEREKTFQPKEIIVHEDWNPSDVRYDADIALLISEHDMHSLFVSPVCLPEISALSSTDNVEGTVIGWGYTRDSENDHENVLRKVQVAKVSQENCFLFDWQLAAISRNQTLCVAGINDVDGLCKGYSGGGLFVETDGVWLVNGIVSSSITLGNCSETKHSIMIKVDSFTQWIHQMSANSDEVHFTLEKKKNPPWIRETERITLFRLNVSRVLEEDDSLYVSSLSKVNDEGVELILEYQKLSFFPNRVGEVFTNLQKIDANKCEIKQIKRSNFENMEKLEELILTNNLIEEILSDTFNDLKKLRIIHLSDNKLKNIHPKTFAKNPSLEEVHVSNNRIQSILSRNFENSNIMKLHIGHNLIETIEGDAFDGADSFKFIDINNNKIKILDKDTFSKNLNLEHIEASNNQIEELPEGLFRNNKKLDILRLNGNKISKIHLEFSALTFYHYEFRGNVCINMKFEGANYVDYFAYVSEDEKRKVLEKMNSELRRSCRS